MSPNTKDVPYLASQNSRKHTSSNDNKEKSVNFCVNEKVVDDGAEGYWRIHDGLYNFTNFIKNHPGGEEWLKLTEGTDITEAFEVHHIRTIPESLLKKYYIRKAKTPRISPYTFKEDGLYKTLKRNISEELGKIPKKAITMSGLYTDFLLLATFAFAIFAAKLSACCLVVPAGYSLAALTVATHNYFHQKDNFRMYYFNLSLMTYRDWRVTHSLSNNFFTNTVLDLEMLLLQSINHYFSLEKGFVQKYFSWIYWPIIWIIYFHMSLINRIKTTIVFRDTRSFSKADFIPYTLPLAIYAFGGQTFLNTLALWNLIVAVASFIFVFVGINTAHHQPGMFNDGDTPRQETDWGILQLDAVADKTETNGFYYLVLASFGDHALRQLFPTLDRGLLDQLYPTVKKTLKEFNMEMQLTSQFELIKKQFQQFSKISHNQKQSSTFWPKIAT